MPESLWKRLGPLELEVDSYELERLEQPVTRGFTRVTTVVHLHGGGEEGLGEDVTWYAEHHDREQAAGAILPLSGSHTIASFSGVLDMPDPHRRWAYESAALDLALRQAGTMLAAAVGREPRPVAFVVSPGLGEPPTSEVVRRWLELNPAHRFKLDPSSDWSDELIAELAATGAVVTADYKAYYLTEDDPPRDGGLPGRLPRGSGPERGDRRRARAAPRPRHLGRADPLGRRRRGTRVSAARGELEAVALRPPAGAARLLRPLRGPRHRPLRRRHVRAGPRPRPDPVPRLAVPPRRPERRRAPAVQRPGAASGPAGKPAAAGPRGAGVSVAGARRYSLTDQSINEANMATAEAIGAGISFALTDEQRALRELAHEFAVKEIRPKAAEYDEHQTHPAEVVATAHEIGLMNPHLPEELGGPGLGAMEGALIGEELCWGCSGIGTTIVANVLGALPVLLAGTDEQKREWLAPLLDEPILCSFALTEPNAGSDVSGIPKTGGPPGGDYVLKGPDKFL